MEWTYVCMAIVAIHSEVYQWYTAVKQDHTRSMLGEMTTGWNLRKHHSFTSFSRSLYHARCIARADPTPIDLRQRFISYIQCSEMFTLRYEKLHTETPIDRVTRVLIISLYGGTTAALIIPLYGGTTACLVNHIFNLISSVLSSIPVISPPQSIRSPCR